MSLNAFVFYHFCRWYNREQITKYQNCLTNIVYRRTFSSIAHTRQKSRISESGMSNRARSVPKENAIIRRFKNTPRSPPPCYINIGRVFVWRFCVAVYQATVFMKKEKKKEKSKVRCSGLLSVISIIELARLAYGRNFAMVARTRCVCISEGRLREYCVSIGHTRANRGR